MSSLLFYCCRVESNRGSDLGDALIQEHTEPYLDQELNVDGAANSMQHTFSNRSKGSAGRPAPNDKDADLPLDVPPIDIKATRFGTPRTPKDYTTGGTTDFEGQSIATTFRSMENDVEYGIFLQRAAGESLGLNIDALDGVSLVVSSVKAGLVRKYNDEMEDEDLKIKPGDSIVELNGARGSSQALLERLKIDGDLDIRIKRPRIFSISIARAYGPLGMQLEHTPTGSSVLVKAVNPGLIKDWNLSHRSLAVKRRDRIFCVNGFQGSPVELMGRMKAATVQGDRLELEICRY
eukprot:TRINITY_DN41198_c0_g1_i1.p1 TRINITY_DN41198_c0_g1~~TRINITY_DN41198_c0_g1_i1.p1  ORF type:complete len:292 (-),score=47.66 TRINITY_DN41198_c0_g1_i1:89-964(-)